MAWGTPTPKLVFGPFRGKGREWWRPSAGQPWTRALFWSAKDPSPQHYRAGRPPHNRTRDFDGGRGTKSNPSRATSFHHCPTLLSTCNPSTPSPFRQSTKGNTNARAPLSPFPNLRLAQSPLRQPVFVCQPPLLWGGRPLGLEITPCCSGESAIDANRLCVTLTRLSLFNPPPPPRGGCRLIRRYDDVLQETKGRAPTNTAFSKMLPVHTSKAWFTIFSIISYCICTLDDQGYNTSCIYVQTCIHYQICTQLPG